MQNGSDGLLRKGLKLSHLRILAAFAECGQINTAAEKIGISQPAASRLLAEIEQILGQPVHERTGRGVGLTAAGQALAARAQRIHIELRDAARDLDEIASGGAAHIRMGSVTGPALDRVLPALRLMRVAQPRVTTEVIVAPSDQLVGQLISGRIDFAIGRLTTATDRAALHCRIMTTEPVALIVRREHPLLQEGAPAPRDLLAFDWVMPGTDSLIARAVINRLQAMGLSAPEQRLSTASFLLTLALVQQSNAIAPVARAVADAFASGPEARCAQLPPLGIEVEPFGLLTRQGMSLPPAAQYLATRILAVQPDTATGELPWDDGSRPPAA